MKKILQRISRLTFVMPVSALSLCSWINPGVSNYANRVIKTSNQFTDTIPAAKQGQLDKAVKDVDVNLANLDIKMNDLHVNLDKQLQALSAIDFDAIQKQTEASLKQIDWNKMQQDVNVSIENAQNVLAKIDFSKMQKDLQALEVKLKSEDFAAHLNAEKMHKQVEGAMKHAKEGMEKTQGEMQQMNAFTDALAADGLVDKKKPYTIEWKSGELYINNQKQPKNIADKYRKYERSGKIKMQPDGVEHF